MPDTLRQASERLAAIHKIIGPVVARQMTPKRLQALMCICAAHLEGEPSTVVAIARQTLQLTQDVRPVAQLMRAKGWVTEEPDPKDRRAKRLVLSAKGLELAAKLIATLKQETER